MSNAAKISSLIVPKWIENGTEDRVILDCDYSIDDRGSNREQNLTVKWFFHDRRELIYEWIPRLDFRYVSGRLQGNYCLSAMNFDN